MLFLRILVVVYDARFAKRHSFVHAKCKEANIEQRIGLQPLDAAWIDARHVMIGV